MKEQKENFHFKLLKQPNHNTKFKWLRNKKQIALFTYWYHDKINIKKKAEQIQFTHSKIFKHLKILFQINSNKKI